MLRRNLCISIIAVISFMMVQVSCSARERTLNVMQPGQVVCGEPPKELDNPKVIGEADVIVPKIGQLLKGRVNIEQVKERVRQGLSPKIASWEVIDYRLCLQYASGILTADDYRRFTEQLVPGLQDDGIISMKQKTRGNRSPAISNTKGHVILGEPDMPADNSAGDSIKMPKAEKTPQPYNESLSQETLGDNSPVVGNTSGNVIIRH